MCGTDLTSSGASSVREPLASPTGRSIFLATFHRLRTDRRPSRLTPDRLSLAAIQDGVVAASPCPCTWAKLNFQPAAPLRSVAAPSVDGGLRHLISANPSFRFRLALLSWIRIFVALVLLQTLEGALAAGEPPTLSGLTVVSKTRWTATAVRKVLRTFAFGGHASDRQIEAWAAMQPQAAIVEMLTFKEHNLLLSPPDTQLAREGLHKRRQTLRALGDFWASADAANLVLHDEREQYARSSWHSTMLTWWPAARVRGGNPFRHRIGYWETNFHNEDFAREFHQLGFGVLGTGDNDYHERVSIKNTAAALTGMRFASNEAPHEWETEKVV